MITIPKSVKNIIEKMYEDDGLFTTFVEEFVEEKPNEAVQIIIDNCSEKLDEDFQLWCTNNAMSSYEEHIDSIREEKLLNEK